MKRERLHFAMPKPVPKGRLRRVPPAIFPPLLGALSLSLAWQGGVRAFALPAGLAGFLSGAIVALFLFTLLAYVVKLTRRPTVLLDEMEILPGRAGVSAGVLALYLFALIVGRFAPALGMAFFVIGLVAHLVTVAVLIRVLATGPVERRQVTPAWHLHFTGFVIAANVAVAQGLVGLGVVLGGVSALAALIVYGLSLSQLWGERVPAPLRPMLAIHLAPVALFGMLALALGFSSLAWGLAIVALIAVVAMAAGARWLTVGGYTALWGAFSFPLAATAGLWVALWAAGGGDVARIVAGILLIGASFIVLTLLFVMMRDWARGRLPVKTNAAIA